MGTCPFFPIFTRSRKYRLIQADVVLELDEDENKGFYFFKDMPKVCKAPSRLPAEPDYKELETFHRHSMLIEDRVLKATSVSLVEPQYKIMHCQDATTLDSMGIFVGLTQQHEICLQSQTCEINGSVAMDGKFLGAT